MKTVFFKSTKKLIGMFLCCLVLAAILINGVGYAFNNKYISVIAAVVEGDKYQIKSQLLMEAMNSVGVCNPEDAANVWANGLKSRSAAAQYSVLTTKLKNEYAIQVDKSFPNWVTGLSSPWVDSYKIIKTDKQSDGSYIYTLCFSTKTSSGPTGNYNAVIKVIKEDGFWRITSINADSGLYVYIGYKP